MENSGKHFVSISKHVKKIHLEYGLNNFCYSLMVALELNVKKYLGMKIKTDYNEQLSSLIYLQHKIPNTKCFI
jgi:hypothetical protein